MQNIMTSTHRRRGFAMYALVALGFGLAAPLAHAQNGGPNMPINDPRWLLLPAVAGWFDGKISLYLSTDTSDPGVAAANPKLNYVPRLGNAANTDAVDDIYHVTNFAQSNILPSSPKPAGPGNTDPNYTPLWQLSMVTWASGTHPHTLRSEQEVKDMASRGLVTLVKTNIVINCPVIYTPSGGKLPGAKVIDLNG